MSEKAKVMTERFATMNNEVISLVENCSDEDWKKVCPGEGWTIGVVIRHVPEAHYALMDLARLIVAGKELPEMEKGGQDQANAQHAQDHADCTKEEVLAMLRDKGASITEFVTGLSDDDLDRSAHFPLAGGPVTAKQMINITVNSSNEHVNNIKAILG